MDIPGDREKINNHKKNIIALILFLAFRNINGVEEVSQFLKNRLYNDDEICRVLELLIQKRGLIKKAFRGVG